MNSCALYGWLLIMMSWFMITIVVKCLTNPVIRLQDLCMAIHGNIHQSRHIWDETKHKVIHYERLARYHPIDGQGEINSGLCSWFFTITPFPNPKRISFFLTVKLIYNFWNHHSFLQDWPLSWAWPLSWVDPAQTLQFLHEAWTYGGELCLSSSGQHIKLL